MKSAFALLVGLFAVLGVMVVVFAVLGFHPAYHQP